MREVFISYKSNDPELGNNDETVANELCQALEAVGITCWIAPRDIEPGTRSYEGAIMRAIKDCKVMLLVFSKFTNDSDDVFKEVANAARRKKQIIPLRIDDAEPSDDLEYHLGSVQWINACGDYSKRIPELIKSLQLKLGKRDYGQTIVVDVPTTCETAPFIPSVLHFTVNGVSFKMARVEGGTFKMGATPEQGDDAFENEKPVHDVSLSTYHIGETQVTQELWQVVMGINPSDHKGDLQCPVEQVSWNDCQEFISRLNQMTGKHFRLPTEAEWEFAARGGNKSIGFKYAGGNIPDEVAWYDSDIDNKSHPVAQKAPNELGLFDMSGNVWEWCEDWYGYYSNNAQKSPKGPSTGSHRVVRGGCWFNFARHCRVSYRGSRVPARRRNYLGLRLAL